MDDVDDLAKRAAAGDAAALDRLLVAVRPEVLARCRRILPNPLDAEEAAQDALLAVARRISSFEGRARFGTWMYQVTVNAARDTYRRLKRRRSLIGVEVEVHDDRTPSVIAGTKVDLLEALDEMDPRFGDAVVLRDLFGCDYAEIAAVLGVAEGTVKSRIHEGRKTLQYLMKG